MAKTPKNDGGVLLTGGLMVLAIVFMIYIVYNHTPEVVVTNTHMPSVPLIRKMRTCVKKQPESNAAPDNVAIRSPSVVTMPPAPSRNTCGEKTALFSGNWYTENCPYKLEFDSGSFRGDPYQSRGQEFANDWTCALNLD